MKTSPRLAALAASAELGAGERLRAMIAARPRPSSATILAAPWHLVDVGEAARRVVGAEIAGELVFVLVVSHADRAEAERLAETIVETHNATLAAAETRAPRDPAFDWRPLAGDEGGGP